MRLAIEFKAVRRFLLHFVLLLALLLAPWPGVAEAFTRAVTVVGELVTPRILAQRVALEFVMDRETPWSTVLMARDLYTHASIQIPIECRSLLYQPLAVFLALALVTPIPRDQPKRELAILIGGFGIMLAIVSGLSALTVVLLLAGATPVRAFELAPSTLTVLLILQHALLAPPGMAYLLPALVWWGLLSLGSSERAQRQPQGAEVTSTIR